MRKSIALFMALLLILCPMTALAASKTTVEHAKTLYELGLFKGTGNTFSEKAMELDRKATRLEVCVTILRMLGKEEKAAYQKNAHPFSDVPSWGDNAVGWLYENYLVNGVSSTYFGAQDTATIQQFSAMLLRVLGYNDAEGDFAYKDAVKIAISVGLIDYPTSTQEKLYRGVMIDMCYNALKTNIQDSKRPLIRKLCDEKAVKASLAEKLGILKPPSIADSFAGVEADLGPIEVVRDGSKFVIKLYQPVEHYGIRVFTQAVTGSGVREIKTSGVPYMEKGPKQYLNGGASGYISEIYVRGLDMARQHEFVVVKTSSEGELYRIISKSTAAWG